MSVTGFCNLAMDVALYHFFFFAILFVWGESLGPTHSQKKLLTQCDYQVGGILEACSIASYLTSLYLNSSIC